MIMMKPAYQNGYKSICWREKKNRTRNRKKNAQKKILSRTEEKCKKKKQNEREKME